MITWLFFWSVLLEDVTCLQTKNYFQFCFMAMHLLSARLVTVLEFYVENLNLLNFHTSIHNYAQEMYLVLHNKCTLEFLDRQHTIVHCGIELR